jgi:hypothetical protein
MIALGTLGCGEQSRLLVMVQSAHGHAGGLGKLADPPSASAGCRCHHGAGGLQPYVTCDSSPNSRRSWHVETNLWLSEPAPPSNASAGILGGKAVPALVPVEVASTPAPAPAFGPQPSSPLAQRPRAGMIELGGGCRVRVDREVARLTRGREHKM